MAFTGRAAIVMSGGMGPWSLLGTALHEAWHTVEAAMEPQERRIAFGLVGAGIPLPGNYHDSLVERSARAFEAFGLL